MAARYEGRDTSDHKMAAVEAEASHRMLGCARQAVSCGGSYCFQIECSLWTQRRFLLVLSEAPPSPESWRKARVVSLLWGRREGGRNRAGGTMIPVGTVLVVTVLRSLGLS